MGPKLKPLVAAAAAAAGVGLAKRLRARKPTRQTFVLTNQLNAKFRGAHSSQTRTEALIVVAPGPHSRPKTAPVFCLERRWRRLSSYTLIAAPWPNANRKV